MEKPQTHRKWIVQGILMLGILSVGVLLLPSASEADWASQSISQSEIDPKTGDPFPKAKFGTPPMAEMGNSQGSYGGLGAPGLNHEGALDPVYGSTGLNAERSPASVPGLAPTPRARGSVPTHSEFSQSYRQSSLQLTDLPKDRALASAIRSKGVQEVSIIAGDLGYFPKTIFVAPEIPVRLYITGASKKPLCLLLDSFNVRKQVRSQKIEEVFFTPSQPGKYRYYCPINGIEGSLIVKDTVPEEPESEVQAESSEGEKQAWWAWPSWGSDTTGEPSQRKTRTVQRSRFPASEESGATSQESEIQWSYASQQNDLH